MRSKTDTVSGSGQGQGGCQAAMCEARYEGTGDASASTAPTPQLLFVDDDRDIQAAARLLFRRHGIEVLAAHDAQEAMTLLSSHGIALVLLDLNYTRGATTGSEGLALLRDMLVLRPSLPVVVVTGHSGVTIAVEAMRAGAADFVMKPWNNDRLFGQVRKLLDKHSQQDAAGSEPMLIVASDGMSRLVALADRLAGTRAHVLICGPPGVGKTLLARRIHARSGSDQPPVVFSGADRNVLPEARGTWICRDIEALTPVMQHRLADRLDESGAPRVLALSSMDRTDVEARLVPRLMFHLGAAVLVLPPLRDRPEEIASLVSYFLYFLAARHGLPEPVLDADRLSALEAQQWDQNVRALRATVERAVLMGTWQEEGAPSGDAANMPSILRDTERSLIEAALRKHGFNVSQAARDLGLTRPALYRRMARYGL